MFVRADATVEENFDGTFSVHVSCPDKEEWKEKYTLSANSDTHAAQTAISRFVEKYSRMG